MLNFGNGASDLIESNHLPVRIKILYIKIQKIIIKNYEI